MEPKPNYELLSSSVVRRNDRNVYYKKLDSAESIQKMIWQDEATYEVSANNINIYIRNVREADFASAVLITFCMDSVGNGKAEFFDLIISDVLGTFISDWY